MHYDKPWPFSVQHTKAENGPLHLHLHLFLTRFFLWSHRRILHIIVHFCKSLSRCCHPVDTKVGPTWFIFPCRVSDGSQTFYGCHKSSVLFSWETQQQVGNGVICPPCCNAYGCWIAPPCIPETAEALGASVKCNPLFLYFSHISAVIKEPTLHYLWLWRVRVIILALWAAAWPFPPPASWMCNFVNFNWKMARPCPQRACLIDFCIKTRGNWMRPHSPAMNVRDLSERRSAAWDFQRFVVSADRLNLKCQQFLIGFEQILIDLQNCHCSTITPQCSFGSVSLNSKYAIWSRPTLQQRMYFFGFIVEASSMA